MTRAVPRFTLIVRDDHEPRHLIRECPTAQDVLSVVAEWLGLPSTAAPSPPRTADQPDFHEAVRLSVVATPGTSAQVAARFPDHSPSSVRGRLSQLAARGVLARGKGGVYRVRGGK